jgi:hypothetical protein
MPNALAPTSQNMLAQGLRLTPEYSIAPEADLGTWTATDEKAFQKGIRQTPWYSQFVKKFGEAPDLNSKDYNYRAAWKSGMRPEFYEFDKEMQHWGSTTPQGRSVKATSHPTAWMEDYMNVTGRDPHEPGAMTPTQIDAIQRALVYRYGGKK